VPDVVFNAFSVTVLFGCSTQAEMCNRVAVANEWQTCGDATVRAVDHWARRELTSPHGNASVVGGAI
jgi:hypothetical protein